MHHCSDIYLKDWLRSLAPSLLQQQPFNQITKKEKWIISKRRLGVAILRVLRIYLQATPFFCVRFFCKNLHPNSNTNSTKKLCYLYFKNMSTYHWKHTTTIIFCFNSSPSYQPFCYKKAILYPPLLYLLTKFMNFIMLTTKILDTFCLTTKYDIAEHLSIIAKQNVINISQQLKNLKNFSEAARKGVAS